MKSYMQNALTSSEERVSIKSQHSYYCTIMSYETVSEELYSSPSKKIPPGKENKTEMISS